MTATVATPSTPKEWEEYVHSFDTPEKFAGAMADGSFKAALTSYGNSQNAIMDDIQTQVKEQAQLAVHDLLTRNGAKTGTAKNRLDLVNKARENMHQNGALYNKMAPGAKADGQFESLGQFVQDALVDPRYASDESIARFKAYSTTVPSEGGYLVPEEFRSDVLSVSLENSVVRPRATVVPMGSSKMKYPAIDFSTEVGEVYGGMIMYWLDEAQTIPDTSASFAAIELELHKLAGLASVPNELVRFAPALETWLRRSMPKAVSHFEDIGFLKGNGVKKPLGALHADNPALITVSKESGQTSGITWNNVLAMFARLLPESYDQSIWVITPDALPEIFTMALPVGTGGSAVMIAPGAGDESPKMTLLGRPIKWSRKAPAALNTKGDISLVDLSTYLIGDGQEMRLDTSAHSSFRSDKTDFRIVEHVDGQPSILEPLTPENGGPTLSAYVQLETRS